MSNSMSLFQATAYCLGDIVGSGIFVSPSAVLKHSESCWISLLIWAGSAIISAFGSCVYIEFATTVKKSGGDFAYLTFVGWQPIATAFYVVGTILTYPSILAVQTLAIGSYFMDGITSFVSINDERLPVLKKLFGFAVLMPIVFLNLFSLRKTVGKFQVLATFLKIAIVLVIIFAGIFNWIRNGKSSTFDEPFANDKVSTGGIALGFYAGLYSYNGWQLLTVGVEEVENPKRTLPIATFSGLFLAASIYLAMNAAYFSVLTVEEFKSTETVAILFLKKALSVELSKFVPFLICFVLIGSLNATLFGSSRYLFVGSRAKIMPSIFSGLHRSSDSPRPAVFAQFFLAIGMSFLGNLEDLINYVSYAIALQQVAVLAALFYMRFYHLQKSDEKILKCPIVIAVLYSAISVALLVIPLLPEFGSYKVAVYAVGLLLIGLLAHFLVIRRKTLPCFFTKIDGYLFIGSQILFDTVPFKSAEI